MSEKRYTIYCYENKLNGMKYVGRTCKTLKSRAGRNGKNYVRDCDIFGNAIQQYGWENFQLDILERDLTKEEAYELEKYWIEKKKSIFPLGYNHSAGPGTLGLHNIHTGMYGKKHTSESKLKMRESHRNIYHPLNRSSSKIVQQFTKNGQFVKEYPSIKEAERQTNIRCSGIGKCCREEQQSCGGYVWKYK